MSQAAGNARFRNLSFFGKILFVGKLILFICSFGFAYPTLLNDPEYGGGVVDRKHRVHSSGEPEQG